MAAGTERKGFHRGGDQGKDIEKEIEILSTIAAGGERGWKGLENQSPLNSFPGIGFRISRVLRS